MIEGGGGRWGCIFCRSIKNVFYLLKLHLVPCWVFTNAIYPMRSKAKAFTYGGEEV